MFLGRLLLAFLSMSSFSAAQYCRKVDIDKSSGFCTVPDPTLTPGAMDASLACVSNADRPRAVTNSEKNQILAAYGWPSNTQKSSGEFDHWLPHWMGGSDGNKKHLVRTSCWQVWLLRQRQSRTHALPPGLVNNSMTLAEAKRTPD